MKALVGTCDFLFITFDTLRYDVAQEEFLAGRSPHLAALLPQGWEKCHAPGSFTYASHQAFFAGFLPTPARPGKHERLFALRFAGSETSGDSTYVFDTPDIVTGFGSLGYRTICIGGVGFFKKENPLSQVLPGLFQESFWQKELGVTDPQSTRNQVSLAKSLLDENGDKVFMFINLSALHQPNYFYVPGAKEDTLETHRAALGYIDKELAPLFEAFKTRPRDTFVILCSDHGTCYGEDGYVGHRLAHEAVWTVPFGTSLIKGAGE